MEIGGILKYHASFRPEHTAFVCGRDRYNFSELNQQVNQLANALKAFGIEKGDKIVSILPNCEELWFLYWACAKIGAVSVPLSPLLRGSGLLNLINDSDCSLIIASEDLSREFRQISMELRTGPDQVWLLGEEKIEDFTSYRDAVVGSGFHDPETVEIRDQDLYNIIYSSGTTGEPKGIMLSHGIRSQYMTLFSSYFRMKPESVVLHTGSIIFNGSFLTTMPAMFLGATFILHENFDKLKLVETMVREKVTHTILVPSQIISALEHDGFNSEQISSLEMILSVGAPLHKKHKEELNARFPGVFYELYGLTEGFVTILDNTEFLRKTGSVGKPPQFFDMKIVDEEGQETQVGEVGEIIGKGPIQMLGYYKEPGKTKEAIRDGWLYSGDLGYVDQDGYLYLAGRKKDMIISGGVNVYPKDIESVILKHTEVKEVAVVGIEDQRWGEAPVAAVVLKEGANVEGSVLKSWINARLEARYHKVREVVFMQDFPRNVAGKTLKREIREEILKSMS